MSKRYHAEVEDSPDWAKSNIQIETSTSYIEPNQAWERFHTCFSPRCDMIHIKTEAPVTPYSLATARHCRRKTLLTKKSEFTNPQHPHHITSQRVTVSKSWLVLEHRIHAWSIQSLVGCARMDVMPMASYLSYSIDRSHQCNKCLHESVHCYK